MFLWLLKHIVLTIRLHSTLQDKLSTGWLAWPAHVELFLAPPRSKSCFKPWEAPSQAGIQAVRDVVLNARFWKALSIHYAEENHNEVTTADNIALVKSICMYIV